VDLTPFFAAWRTTPLPDREVVDALVDPVHAGPPPSPPLLGALATWPGHYYWADEPDGRHLVLSRSWSTPRREHWALHALLFLSTLYTVTLTGAVMAGSIPYDGLLTFFHFAPTSAAFWRAWSSGLVFSLPLLAILLCHELGHYVTARRYLLDVSPPYFIPLPLAPSFGTMGAFIRLRTLLSDRRQLFDVGIAGPIAGFLVALPVLAIGLARSQTLPMVHDLHGMWLFFGSEPVTALGDSPLTWILRHYVTAPAGSRVLALHPLAFAGWVGMFVTMLNLLPISQLDGGHVLFAAVPRWHQRVAQLFWLALAGMGWWWTGWLVWGVLVLALSRGRLGHPPVLDVYRPLPRSRRWLAWGAVGLLGLTFMPVPFHL
jgi:Zn-dependent protease